ncbi:MAG: DUF58 domain-containing protein [Polyangiaceae bacterium]|jgi:uncharacterized protein (DUF58 family)|nr:DUF58 domain-containing protein [Polyangiaceae bacterium]
MKTEGRSGNDDDTAGDAETGAPAPPPSLAGISLFDEAAEPKPRRGKPAPPREPRDAKAERSEPAPKLAPEEPALPEPKRTARRLKLTREGKYYLGITLGVGFAAINTGNNLLYLLLGMLLSLIVVSGVMSELSLQKLSVTRRLPLRAQVGRAHLVEIEVFNHKGKVPSYAIEVEDLRAGQPADKRCFFLKISPTSAQVAAYRRTPARRGRDHHTGFRIATRFPFGLFEKSREVRAPGDLIIYPAVDPVRLPIEQGSRNGNSGRVVGRGGGDDIYTVRPMRQGDDPRDIYWRKSAGMPQLVLRDRVREARPDVELVLDVIRPGQPSAEFANGFERRVRELASRGVAHLKRGDSVVVRTSLGQRASASRSTGADPVLRFLALVEPVDEKDAATAKGAAGRPALPPAPKQTNGAASKSAEAGSA